MRSPVAKSNGCAPVLASYLAITLFTSSMSAVAGSYSRSVVSPREENVTIWHSYPVSCGRDKFSYVWVKNLIRASGYDLHSLYHACMSYIYKRFRTDRTILDLHELRKLFLADSYFLLLQLLLLCRASNAIKDMGNRDFLRFFLGMPTLLLYKSSGRSEVAVASFNLWTFLWVLLPKCTRISFCSYAQHVVIV